MNNQYIEKARTGIRLGGKNENPLFIVLMGLPGSGKSYVASYLNKKYYFTVLSGENITHAIFGTEKCTGLQYRDAYEVLRFLAKDLIGQGYSVVIDGTNLKYEFRKQIYDTVIPLIRTSLIYLVTDDATALARANQRGEKYHDPTDILSSVSPETFASFKSQLELPQENEQYHQIISDENVFKNIDKIIQELRR